MYIVHCIEICRAAATQRNCSRPILFDTYRTHAHCTVQQYRGTIIILDLVWTEGLLENKHMDSK